MVYTCTENPLLVEGQDWVEIVAGSQVPVLQEYIGSNHLVSSPSSSAGRRHQLRKFRFWQGPWAGTGSKSQLQKFRFWKAQKEVVAVAEGEYLTKGDAPSLDSVQEDRDRGLDDSVCEAVERAWERLSIGPARTSRYCIPAGCTRRW